VKAGSDKGGGGGGGGGGSNLVDPEELCPILTFCPIPEIQV